jgi:hypothetical protein
MHSNAFKNNNSRKQSCRNWNRIYVCKNNRWATHRFQVKSFSETRDTIVRFKCEIDEKIIHAIKLFENFERICGHNREIEKLKIISDGIENTYNEKIIEISQNVTDQDQVQSLISLKTKIQFKDRLRKEELLKRDGFGSDPMEDIIMEKRYYEGVDRISKNLKGYIQSLLYHALSFLMQLESQVFFLNL